ncbi:10887_t:CDS:2 [Paraglomus occultum]|uniref:10887_t:CDS:1 n=1 Tax=Paraglomus occultum TaxID=144539 RepID=A0A9N9A5G7_9GLOM|nr:10887_t:CDS:2 [Paraglomus occultum]
MSLKDNSVLVVQLLQSLLREYRRLWERSGRSVHLWLVWREFEYISRTFGVARKSGFPCFSSCRYNMRTVRVDPLSNCMYVIEYPPQFKGYITQSDYHAFIERINEPYKVYRTKAILVSCIFFLFILFDFLGICLVSYFALAVDPRFSIATFIVVLVLLPVALASMGYFQKALLEAMERERSRISSNFTFTDKSSEVKWYYTPGIFSFSGYRQPNIVIELPDKHEPFDVV